MGFFKKIGKGLGRFAKKVAGSGLGKTVLGAAATIVGGPAAGALMTKVTGLLGEKKTGEMASKVVNDGTVKQDKVMSTLKSMGISTDTNTVNDVSQALKNAAMGIGNKPISITGAGFNPPVQSSSTGNESSVVDKAKNIWYKVKNWVVANWKKILLFGVLPVGLIVLGWKMFGKRKKYRR